MGRGDQDTVEFKNVVCVKATDAALLCRFDDGTEEWIPKSQVHDDSEVFDDEDNDRGTLVITQWFAEKSGLG